MLFLPEEQVPSLGSLLEKALMELVQPWYEPCTTNTSPTIAPPDPPAEGPGPSMEGGTDESKGDDWPAGGPANPQGTEGSNWGALFWEHHSRERRTAKSTASLLHINGEKLIILRRKKELLPAQGEQWVWITAMSEQITDIRNSTISEQSQ